MLRARPTRARPPRIAMFTLSVLCATASTSIALLCAADDRQARHQPREESRASGIRVAVRSGAAVPVGRAFAGSRALSSSVTGYLPLRLDLGYRIDPHVYIGVAGQYAVIVPNDCPGDSRCSGSNSRVGAMVAYHLLPTRLIDPWVGAGVGFEMFDVSRASGGRAVHFSARGAELLDVELGADVRVTRALRLGPVLSTSLARFTAISVNEAPSSEFDTSLHAWIMVGLRGALDL